MSRGLWPFLLLLLGVVVCVSAIPQPDLPETAFNEVDTPINQAPPVVPGVKFIRPEMTPVILPREVWGLWHGVSFLGRERKAADSSLRPDPRSSQDLLCTFLV